MAQTVLPNSINYSEQLPALMPGVQNYTQVIMPNNGAKFYQNQQIFVDIPSRAFIDPQSIYIRYKMYLKTTAAQTFSVLGCPVYTPFARVDTLINSAMYDSVVDYNQVAHAWTNLNLGVNEKYGNQFGFGYADETPATVSMDELDGRYMGSINGETSYFVSAPLVCTKLTGCEKFIPAFATGGIRLIFTLDTIANMLSTVTNVSVNDCYITNFELVYDLLDFGAEVEQSVLSLPTITIKTNGYANSAVTLPTDTIGSTTLVFNQRFASIRSAIVHPSGTAVTAKTLNGKFDAVDVTSGGYYSLNVGGVAFPQGGPLSMGNNKAGIMSELRKATGNLYDWSKSMAINSVEFGYTEDSTTTITQPGKCYIGFDLNKINSSGKNMLNGTSSQNSPINLNLNIATRTVSNKSINMILNYDCILQIDPLLKQINMNQ